MTATMATRIEGAGRMSGWHDRAWAIGLAAAVVAGVAAAMLGGRGWLLVAIVFAPLAAGAAISIKASLARLDEAARRQRTRSIAIGLVLGGLVAIFYAATIVRLGGNVLNRPL
jgi:hypothetical protein